MRETHVPNIFRTIEKVSKYHGESRDSPVILSETSDSSRIFFKNFDNYGDIICEDRKTIRLNAYFSPYFTTS